MKKIAFLIVVFLYFPVSVKASDLVLEDLKIKNGTLSIPFDKLNNEYTVILEKDVLQIDLEYKTKEGIEVFVNDNYDLANNSVVTLLLKDEKNSVEYHLQVYKEEEEKTISTFLENPQVSLETNFMFEYKNYIIPITCLFLIFIVFKILFHKHKK